MANPAGPIYPYSFFCDGDVRQFVPDHIVADLSPEHPTWPSDLRDGPLPVYCYSTGDLVFCPQVPAHNKARTIGVDREACGIVCDDCKTVYATSRLLPPECFDGSYLEDILYV